MVELHPTGNGGVFLKAAFQTSAGCTYVVSVSLANYPSQMPKVFVTAPALVPNPPHYYREGNICYMHPNFWNPGRFNLVEVLKRTAKWLNKYDVWRVKREWPGAEILH